ncbi:MAG TPA: RNA polymerase sigma factor [Caulobacteraceae bacterium]
MTRQGGDADDELVRLAGQGDAGAIRALVRAKLPRIFALARRMLGDIGEAEDVAQETFVRAWRHAPRWRPGEARFETWLHKVALNLCYDTLRRRRGPRAVEAPDLEDPGPPPDRNLQARDVGRRVDAALQALPARQREAIVLCHHQELGNIEAAALMGVSVGALESLLGRGRRALRVALADLADGR